MPLILREPPPDAILALEEGMGQAMLSPSEPGGGVPFGLTIPEAIDKFVATSPLPALTLDPAVLLEGRDSFLSGAKHVGWKYLIVRGEKPAGVATVSDDANGEVDFGKYQIDGVTGPLVDALHVAETSPETQAKDFTCSFFEIRSLYFSSLWLHADDQDLIIPLADCAAGEIPALSIQSPATILSMLRARQAQGSPLPPRSQDGGYLTH